MPVKILHIGVVEHAGNILMRKKPDGSEPYTETWYIFGGTVDGDNVDQSLVDIVRDQTGVDIHISERLGWDTEIKQDHDGVEKLFIYLDSRCDYVGGEIVVGDGLETVAWVPIDRLSEYDIVPPSQILFRKLGYMD